MDIKKMLAPKAKEMMEHDKKEKDLFRKIDKMIELDYSLPDAIGKLKWMRKVVSTDPLTAITVGRRTLATIKPKVFIQPLNDNIVTKRMANMNEQNLLLQLKYASRRAEHDIVGDIVESALRYDMVAAMTVPVQWQLEGTGITRNIKNPNGFMSMVESPLNIFPRYSPLGLESVLHVKTLTANEVVRFYGDKAADLKKVIEKEDKELYVTLFDYWDYDQRATWCSEASDTASLKEATSVEHIINDGEMKLPFLPWSIEKGGTSLSSQQDHKVRPMLGAIAHADAWDLQNISKSIAVAESLAYAAAPGYKITTYADDGGMQVEYGDINKPVIQKPGEDIAPLAKPTIDDNLLKINDMVSQDINMITGLKLLATVDFPSGTAFATANAQLKAAASSLDPAKGLAERAVGGILEDMLQWSSHTEEDITALGDGSNMKEDDTGRRYHLKWEHIQPDMIDVEVKLSAHIPTDQLQKINAATLLKNELDFSTEDAWKELEVANPEEIRDRWEQEQLDDVMLQNKIKVMSAEGDAEAQQILMSAVQPPPQEGGMNAESESQARMAQSGMPSGRIGTPRREAQSQAAQANAGFDPSRGGMSPNELNPGGFLREGISGRDKAGGAV